MFPRELVRGTTLKTSAAGQVVVARDSNLSLPATKQLDPNIYSALVLDTKHHNTRIGTYSTPWTQTGNEGTRLLDRHSFD